MHGGGRASRFPRGSTRGGSAGMGDRWLRSRPANSRASDSPSLLGLFVSRPVQVLPGDREGGIERQSVLQHGDRLVPSSLGVQGAPQIVVRERPVGPVLRTLPERPFRPSVVLLLVVLQSKI